jgi:Na+-transporting NADH:ubiquinone oxidoreductase subunit NqrF
MILDLLESGDSRTIYLFQGARDLAELYNRELFEQLVKDYPNFRYIPALNAPNQKTNGLDLPDSCMRLLPITLKIDVVDTKRICAHPS